MLIEDAEVAEYYKEGDLLFQKKDFRNGALRKIEAFETAKARRQFNQSGSMILVDYINASNAVKKLNNEAVTAVLNYANKIFNEIEVLKLGLDYKEWREYRLPLGSLNPYDEVLEKIKNAQNDDNKPVFLTMTDEEISVWFVKIDSFIIRSILLWQERKSLWEFQPTNILDWMARK